jgi:Pathogenicity locus.
MLVMKQERQLKDLVSVGPAMLRDFAMLGIRNVAQLARQEPRDMYDRMCVLTSQRQDPCVLDTFTAAVAQARDPELPPEQRQWWYWSRERKRHEAAHCRARKAKAARAGR